ncbi:MAG: hypothetical protein M3474_06360 [Actinomycetota bacterium]|nr:hypothetical protein [Actinomycetota bacterium]
MTTTVSHGRIRAYWVFVAGLVPFAAGMALAGTPATTAIVSLLPESKQGVASAVNDTSRELGSALGIALLGSVLNESYRNGIREALAACRSTCRSRRQTAPSHPSLSYSLRWTDSARPAGRCSKPPGSPSSTPPAMR